MSANSRPIVGHGAPAPKTPPLLVRLWTQASPKHLVSALITIILVVGELKFGVLGGYDRLITALGTCMLTEALLARWLLGHWPPSLLSAYISGNSIALLVKPQEGLLWPFAVVAVISIASKYVLRFRGSHLWNPTNFGISVLLLLAAPKVAILSHEWGNALVVNAVIWAIGLLVVRRAGLLHVTAAYVVSFVALAWMRSLAFDLPFLTEVGPITGPMYQLFVFFMITDPPTSVRSLPGRLAVAVIIALVECGLRVANDLGHGWAEPFASAPAFYALFVVGPIALFVTRKPRPS